MSYKIITLTDDVLNDLIIDNTISSLKTKLDRYDTIYCEDNYSQNIIDKLNKINSKDIKSYQTYKSIFLTNKSLKGFKMDKKYKILLYLECKNNYTDFESYVGKELLNKKSKKKIIKKIERKLYK